MCLDRSKLHSLSDFKIHMGIDARAALGAMVQPADKETGALTFTCRKHWEEMLLREVRDTPTYAFAGSGAQCHVQRNPWPRRRGVQLTSVQRSGTGGSAMTAPEPAGARGTPSEDIRPSASAREGPTVRSDATDELTHARRDCP